MPPIPPLPASKLRSRLPSLDGIRALSILAVLTSHLAATIHTYPFLAGLGFLGILGVRVFFVLSGFLITFLLLEERKRTGAISLRGFYRRRTLRILPAFYAYLLVTALLKMAGFLHVPWSDFAISAGFLTDFLPTAWNLEHFWSLSSEEQFYLLWPALLLFAGPPNAIKAAWAAMLATPLLSEGLSKLHFPQLALIALSVNAIATGCVLAGMRERWHANALYMRVLRSPWIDVLIPVPLLLACWQGTGVVLLYALTAASVAILIDRVVTVPCRLSTFLNWQPLASVGAMSYSLYVWQQIFLNRYLDTALTTFPLNLLLTALCALLSFYFVERPFLALKKPKQSLPLQKLRSLLHESL